MRISELIEKLREARTEHGDVEVYTVRSDMADYDPELTVSHHGCLYIG